MINHNYVRFMIWIESKRAELLQSSALYLFVELPGVEPGSKQAAKPLSTCLALSWLSGRNRQKATQSLPYSLWFSSCRQDSGNLILPFSMP